MLPSVLIKLAPCLSCLQRYLDSNAYFKKNKCLLYSFVYFIHANKSNRSLTFLSEKKCIYITLQDFSVLIFWVKQMRAMSASQGSNYTAALGGPLFICAHHDFPSRMEESCYCYWPRSPSITELLRKTLHYYFCKRLIPSVTFYMGTITIQGD